MKKQYYLLLFSVICVTSAFQINPVSEIPRQFLNFINEGKFAEAEALTTDSFKVQFNYSTGEKKKTAFFDYSKKRIGLKPEIKIDSNNIVQGNPVYYVQNTSELNKFLKLKSLPLKYSFKMNKEKIEYLQIDSMKGYNAGSRINDRRWQYFENWISRTHPEINMYYIKINHNDSLMGLAREFYQVEVKK